MRLICNLLDGMVAVEGGKKAKDGPFWNEAPDRIADALLFAGAGYAAGYPALGWAAAVLAVGTAYIRELGRAEGFPPDFSGPMAKPQRMAVLTGAAVLAAVEPVLLDTPVVLWAALWIVVIGAALTAIRRSARLIAALKSR
jgi:phosphatidylglycerophosphate synthase